MESIIANGEILKIDDYIPYSCETPVVLKKDIWFGFGGIPLFSDNLEVVKSELSILNAPVPQLFNDLEEFFRITKRLLNRMRFFRSGVLTLSIYAGQTETNFILKAKSYSDFTFPISKQGIMLGFAGQTKFSRNKPAQLAFYNGPLWETTKTEIQNSSCTNVVFLNENDFVTECIGANIFGVKNRELITPSVETGCYIDVIRNYIISSGSEIQMKVVESDSLSKEALMQMDEIFIASEAKGIEWVMGIGNKRYVHSVSDLIQVRLNETLKKLV